MYVNSDGQICLLCYHYNTGTLITPHVTLVIQNSYRSESSITECQQRPCRVNCKVICTAIVGHNVPFKSKLQHPPRAFDRFNLPGGGEFDPHA